jgi:hypothetical protein
MRLSPDRLSRKGLLVILAVLQVGWLPTRMSVLRLGQEQLICARRKALTKRTQYPVRPVVCSSLKERLGGQLLWTKVE